MAFDWKKKLDESRAAAGAVFKKAAAKTGAVVETVSTTAGALNDRIEEGKNALLIKAEEKLIPRRKKPGPEADKPKG
jgi:hypothetical protein